MCCACSSGRVPLGGCVRVVSYWLCHRFRCCLVNLWGVGSLWGVLGSNRDLPLPRLLRQRTCLHLLWLHWWKVRLQLAGRWLARDLVLLSFLPALKCTLACARYACQQRGFSHKFSYCFRVHDCRGVSHPCVLVRVHPGNRVGGCHPWFSPAPFGDGALPYRWRREAGLVDHIFRSESIRTEEIPNSSFLHSPR